MATGGTASSVEQMLIKKNKEVTGLVIVIELQDLGGENILKCPVDSVVSFNMKLMGKIENDLANR